MHPRFELPPASDPNKELPKRPPVCHNCGELGHKASFCPKMPLEQRESDRHNNFKNPPYNHHAQQKLQSQLREQQKENSSGAQNNEQQQQQQQIQSQPTVNAPPHPGPGQFHPHPNHHHHHHHHNSQQPRPPFQPRKLEDITCFKCGMKGHYANRCYSFLNNSFMGNNGGNNKAT